MNRRTFGALLLGAPVIGIPALGLLPPAPKPCPKKLEYYAIHHRTDFSVWMHESDRMYSWTIDGDTVLPGALYDLCSLGKLTNIKPYSFWYHVPKTPESERLWFAVAEATRGKDFVHWMKGERKYG